MQDAPAIRDARPDEHAALGALMVSVYAQLEGFPSPQEQPAYYAMLADIGRLAERPGARLFVAHVAGRLAGGVVYFSDMAQYGSGGSATRERDAAGFRLLAVDPAVRGAGVGRALVEHCLAQARRDGRAQVVLHTTDAMRVAWGLYERLGFRRSEDLDFLQGALPVFGFRLPISPG